MKELLEIKLREMGFVVPLNVPTLTLDGERKSGIEVLNNEKTIDDLVKFILELNG